MLPSVRQFFRRFLAACCASNFGMFTNGRLFYFFPECIGMTEEAQVRPFMSEG